MARIFFCLTPALLVSAVLAVIHPGLGVIAFAATLHMGFAVTEVRPERGEGKR